MMCGWRILPVTCIKPLKFEKVMQDATRGFRDPELAARRCSRNINGGSELGGNR
jgi:hypothetical protein